MRNFLSISTGLILSCTASSAFSKENIKLAYLDPITVYATRSPNSSFDIPAMASVLDIDEAGNSLSSDMADLFEFTAGVEVENGPRRNGQTLAIRGFDNDAILTLIDGRRQNFEAAHDGRFYLDPSLVKKVEVVRGPASASYGAGALGGVVAFETKDARDLLLKDQKVGAQTSLGFRTGNHEFSSLLSAYGAIKDFDVVASASYRTDRDIRQGNSDRLDSENNLASALFKISNIFAKNHLVSLQYQGSQNKGHEPNNGSGAITNSNPIVNKDISDSQFSLKYALVDSQNDWLSPKIHLYHNQTEVQEVDIKGTNIGRIQDRAIKTNGINIDNQSSIAFGENHQQKLSYGFEYYGDKQEGFNSKTINNVRAGVPSASSDYKGFYLQDDLLFKGGFGQVNLIPAMRYDAYKSSDETGKSQEEDQLSPKISLGYKPIPALNLFASFARAFRAPNLTELYPSGTHFPGNNFVANPDLKPETVDNFEAGLGIKLKDIAVQNDQFQIKGAVYQSKGKDFISQTISATTTKNINVKEADLRGFEVESEYQINNLTTKFGLSYTKAEDGITGAYLTNNVPLTFVADINYKILPIQSLLGLRGRFAKENDRTPSEATQTAGYAVYDLYYRFTKQNSNNEDILVFDFGIENVLDKSYTKRFATLRDEGRSVVGKISYKW